MSAAADYSSALENSGFNTVLLKINTVHTFVHAQGVYRTSEEKLEKTKIFESLFMFTKLSCKV